MAKSRSKTARRPVKNSPARRKAKAVAKPAAKAVSSPKGTSSKGKWVYGFLGGKGAGLAEMAQLGLPVPPGFTITTEVCTYFYDHGKTYPKDLKAQVEAG